jgi:hypothetical protein
VLTPFYPRLLVVSAARDFEQVLSSGVGLAAQGPYHAYALTGPDRVVLDVSHVALAKFPGIWDITSWQGPRPLAHRPHHPPGERGHVPGDRARRPDRHRDRRPASHGPRPVGHHEDHPRDSARR